MYGTYKHVSNLKFVRHLLYTELFLPFHPPPFMRFAFSFVILLSGVQTGHSALHCHHVGENHCHRRRETLNVGAIEGRLFVLV